MSKCNLKSKLVVKYKLTLWTSLFSGVRVQDTLRGNWCFRTVMVLVTTTSSLEKTNVRLLGEV